MGKKSYINVSMCVGVFVVLVALLFMAQPSRADFGLIDSTILRNISDSIEKLANNVGELVAVEREKNEILKLIKNKLSDIAGLQAIRNGSACLPMYAESEEDSGIKAKGRYTPIGSIPSYFYYNDMINRNSTKE